MADQELKIRLTLDKTAAERQSAAFHAAEKQRLQTTLSETEVAERAKTAAIIRENRQRIQEEAKRHKTKIDMANEAARAEEEASREANKFLRAGLGFVGLQSGFSAVNRIVGSIADDMQRVTQNTIKAGDAYARYRRSLLEGESIKGGQADDAAVQKSVGTAKRLGIDPNRFVDFQQKMNEEAFGTVGEKFSQKQYDEITEKAAKFAQSRNLEGTDVTGLIGNLMRNSKDGATSDDVIDQFGKIFNVLENAPGATARLMPELTQAMAGGMEATKAAKYTAIMAQRGRPRESGTYVAAMERSIRNLFTKDNGQGAADLGLTEDMDEEASARAIFAKAQAAGIDLNDPKKIGIWLKRQGVDEQEGLDALRTFYNKGIKGGGIETADKLLGRPGLPVFQGAIDRFNKSPEGKTQAIEAGAAGSEILSGDDASLLRDATNRARDQYFATKRSQQTTPGDLIRGMMPNGLFGTTEEQIIRTQALRNAREEARSLGIKNIPETPPLAGPTQVDNAEIVRLLKLIAENSKPKANLGSGGPAQPPARAGGLGAR